MKKITANSLPYRNIDFSHSAHKYNYVLCIKNICFYVVKNTYLFFPYSLAAVQDFNYKWGYINEKGHVIIPFLIDQPSKFADANQIKVMINAQWVVINKQT